MYIVCLGKEAIFIKPQTWKCRLSGYCCRKNKGGGKMVWEKNHPGRIEEQRGNGSFCSNVEDRLGIQWPNNSRVAIYHLHHYVAGTFKCLYFMSTKAGCVFRANHSYLAINSCATPKIRGCVYNSNNTYMYPNFYYVAFFGQRADIEN